MNQSDTKYTEVTTMANLMKQVIYLSRNRGVATLISRMGLEVIRELYRLQIGDEYRLKLRPGSKPFVAQGGKSLRAEWRGKRNVSETRERRGPSRL